MKTLFTIVKVLFGLISLGCLGSAIYVAIAGIGTEPAHTWVTVASLLGVGLITGAMAVRDLIAWLKSRKK